VAAASAQQASAPGVGQSPYGQLSSLPAVNVPEPKVGISARPARQAITTLRPSPLLTLRATTPRFGAGPAPRTAGAPSASPSALTLGAGAACGGSPASALLPARENPHRLFIRDPPPSTAASPGRSSLTPSTPVAGGATKAAEATPASGAPPGSGAPGSGRPSTGDRYYTNGEAPPSEGRRGADASPGNSDLLPRLGSLATQGYSYEPSPRQLQVC
jgi:hypothetical protein